jgi:hypothetical protein
VKISGILEHQTIFNVALFHTKYLNADIMSINIKFDQEKKEIKKMKAFVKYMATMNGRIIRIVVGVVLLLLGFFVVSNTTLGTILMIIGLVFVAVGAFDVCLIAPLIGMSIQGKKIRGG